MSLDYTIETCQIERQKEVFALYQRAFLTALGEEGLAKRLTTFQKELEDGRVLIANLEKRIVGFAAYDFVSENNSIKNQLAFARDRECEESLRQYLKGNKEKYGGEIIIEYFDNEVTNSENNVFCDEDMLITSVYTIPDFRRQRIAKALTTQEIKIAKNNGSKRIFVNCYQGSEASKLYEKLGFLPIIKTGPNFFDGSSLTLMGKNIQK